MEGIIEPKVLDQNLIDFENSIEKINRLITEGLSKDEIALLLEVLTPSKTKAKLSTKRTQKIDSSLAKLAGIKSLRKEFKLVELDSTVKRTLKLPSHMRDRWTAPGKTTIQVPLIWSVKLPIREKVIIKNVSYVQVTTTAPNPCKEAMEQLSKHGNRFDHCECWWVPNSFNIEKKPKPKTPDPILVGVITVPVLKKKYCFELHRWIDETVETGWWSLEGY